MTKPFEKGWYNHFVFQDKKLLEINKTAQIIPIKIFEAEDVLNEEYLQKGIQKAIDLNVDIINISCGSEQYEKKTEELVRKAEEKGIIIVAPAGNSGKDLLYPAKYDKVISVMARDINNRDVNYNCKSTQKKSFSAPGDHVLCDGEYYNGTSIATVYITALIASLKEENPELSCQEVTDWLILHAKYGTETSYGFVIRNEKPLMQSLGR